MVKKNQEEGGFQKIAKSRIESITLLNGSAFASENQGKSKYSTVGLRKDKESV